MIILLCHRFPRVYNLEDNRDASVAEKLTASIDGSFRRSTRGGVEEQQFVQLQNLVILLNLLDDNFLPKSNNATRWVKFIPIKVNVFAWKEKAAEDSSHLFFSCELAVEVSRLVCRWWDMTWPHISSYEEWLSWLKDIRLDSNRKLLLEGVFYTAWWSIWRERPAVFLLCEEKAQSISAIDVAWSQSSSIKALIRL
ncbi:hypothetical protein Tco_1286040 [Tanacetum coccineum]